jgi:hypothetical protein
MNHDCTTHPFLSFITITTKLLSNRDDWLSLFQFYRKTFLRSVHDFSGEVHDFSGEVQNDLRGGAHLHLKIRP